MTALANQHQAVNLAQGFPDFACSEKLIDLVNHYMKKGFNQYAPMPGIMSLREKIAAKTEALYSAKYDPEKEITITPGGTHALYAAITAIVKEGDEVIVFGNDLPVQQLAQWANTIPYEIVSTISRRVKRVYFQE